MAGFTANPTTSVLTTMLIALNVLLIGITAYYQPYLTDSEFLKIKRRKTSEYPTQW
jgi:hypothetical protein